ncbi:hypothetical protein KX816_08875 [Sphingosinicellaceae bacterium]|nr:hypothetical protein KX816_08875 [Sphingosinicellaceae bacterium]
MNDGAPRITAGYDDAAPREIVFPPASRRSEPALREVDAVALGKSLAARLGALCDIAATAAPASGEPLAMSWWQSEEGALFGIGGGAKLASALLNRQCGGAFEEDGAPVSSHALRCLGELVVQLRAALMPDATGWTPVKSDLPAESFTVTLGTVRDRIDLVAQAPAQPACAPVDHSEWRAQLRRVLGGLAIPVRLVLHEGNVAVRAARAFKVGDVLPIATAHEVGLRIGSHALARGHIIDADTGSPRVRIVARSRRTPAFGDQA